MPSLPPRAQRLRDANAQLAMKQSDLYRSRVRATLLTEALAHMQRRGDDVAVGRLREELTRLGERNATLAAEIDRDRAGVTTAARDWAENTPDPIADLVVDTNVALLPVRLETRFKADANGDDELLVRIYPDDVHVNAHEPELTQREREAGDHYWVQRTDSDDNAQRNAWAALAEEFGAPRASWIARVTDPTASESIDARADEWSRGAFTNVLPDRWMIVGIVGDKERFRVWGNPVPDSLQVGVDPEAQALENEGTTLGSIDPQLRWLEDFTAAEELGMGVRVPAKQVPQGTTIDLLLAVGVKSTLSQADSSARLQQLLTAHRYTQGMAFVPRGTPTNNTEQTSSGFSSQDIAHERSFSAERHAEEDLDPASNGARLARALGLSSGAGSVFRGLTHAAALDHPQAEAMQAALWPVTWGYYLKEMMADEVSDADIEFGRQFFLDWVRAGGWLATLTIGQQPYAFWPVTDGAKWQPRENREDADQLTRFANYLRLLRGRWINASDQIPTVGSITNPAANLMSVLGMDGVSRHHYARGADSGAYLLNLWAMTGLPADSDDLDSLRYLPNSAALIEEFADVYDVAAWDPFIRRLMFHPDTLKLDGARIQSGELSSTDSLRDNYVEWLRKASPKEIEDELPYAGKHMPLLYLLLRHAALLEYGRTAITISENEGLVAKAASREPVLVNLEGSPELTYRSVMLEEIPGVTGEMTFAEHMHRFKATYRRRDAQFNAFWSALGDLENLPTRLLDLLTRETLDLASHRYEAWILGFANQRFEEARDARSAGIQLGGFGWVENLHKRFSPRSEGRILAPGHDHATAAAILRAGYVAHKKQHDRNALAVNLASDRVRLAKSILEGVAIGLPLGAVLGYRFERMLHEHALAPSLDRYIHSFRKLAPLDHSLSENELVAVGQVVDGYKLHQRFKARELDTSFVQAAHRDAVTDTLAELGNVIDAVGDALLAEGIFQIVKRNRERTRATLDSIARGETDPPELEFARSLRSGVSFTHRVVVSLPEDTATPGWPARDHQVRRLAEPRLNAWLASLLPAADGSGCVVKYGDLATGNVTVADLGLAPVDLLHLSAAGYSPGTELYQRFLTEAVAQAPPAVREAGDVAISLDFDQPVNTLPTTVAFARLMRHVDVLRGLVEDVRFLRPHEVAATDQAEEAAWDVQELRHRVDQLVDKLRAWQLSAAQGDASVSIPERLEQLWRAAAFGLSQSVPETDVPDDSLQEHLRLQVGRVESVVNDLLARHNVLEAQLDRATAEDTEIVEHDVVRANLLLGEAFVIVPRFAPSHPAEYQAAVDARNVILGANAGTKLPEYAWFSKYARVQRGMGRLNRAYATANRLRREDVMHLSILQFPFAPDARWVGLPLANAEPESAANKVSVAVLGPLPDGAHFAGLLVDTWAESIPHANVDAAISFNFDQPGSRAPNAILLATPPRLGEGWKADTMLAVVREALQTAKMRAVDGTALTGVGQFLPAIMLATNDSKEAVQTDINRAMRPKLSVAPTLDVVLKRHDT